MKKRTINQAVAEIGGRTKPKVLTQNEQNRARRRAYELKMLWWYDHHGATHQALKLKFKGGFHVKQKS